MSSVFPQTIVRQLEKLVKRSGEPERTDRQLLEGFVARRDEAAFTALVDRHGPMVLGVCRRTLRNVQDAEDAFQATFLILARRARSIERKQSIAGWLYQVAYHLAVKARMSAARRSALRPREVEMATEDPLSQANREEIKRLLDDELQTLPEQFRNALVLCHLEGLTQDEAASQLGWSKGTLRRRLGKAREMLRLRLVRRGLSLSAALTVSLAGPRTAEASVPLKLAVHTARAAVQLSTRGAVAGLATAQAMRLMELGLKTFFLTKAKVVAGAILAVSALLGASAVTWRGAAESQAAVPPSSTLGRSASTTQSLQARSAAERTSAKEPMKLVGQVTDPDGMPAPRAKVAVLAYPNSAGPRLAEDTKCLVLAQGNVDSNGRIRFLLSRLSSDRFQHAVLAASAPGYALTCAPFDPDAIRPEVTIRLEPEAPLKGRLIDLQGNPGVGVRVHLASLSVANGSYLSEPADATPVWPGSATSDADGRFMLNGIGPNCTASLTVRDDRFAHGDLGRIQPSKDKEIQFLLSPPRMLSGLVTYADSGKPVSNARLLVMAVGRNFHTSTNSDGHYRVAVSGSGHVYARPPDGEPFLALKKYVDWPKGGVIRQEVNLALPRGLVRTGKIVDSASGKAVAGAEIQYFPQTLDNSDYRPELASCWHTAVESDANGTFQMALPPGPGHLLVRGPSADYVHQEIPFSQLIEGRYWSGGMQAAPEGNAYSGSQRFYAHAIVPVHIKRDSQPDPVRVTLRRGKTIHGRLIDAAGKPVGRALMVSRLNVMAWDHVAGGRSTVYDGHFELRGCDPKASYRVIFFDPSNQQGAVTEIASTSETVTVQLAPCGTAKARFVSGDHDPVPHRRTEIDIVVNPGSNEREMVLDADVVPASGLDWQNYGVPPRSDDKGCLTLPALIPGATYRLGRGPSFIFRSDAKGKTQDWGKVRNAIFFAE
jgi:RNA polymerase sigma factor (sigma-70 family)